MVARLIRIIRMFSSAKSSNKLVPLTIRHTTEMTTIAVRLTAITSRNQYQANWLWIMWYLRHRAHLIGLQCWIHLNLRAHRTLPAQPSQWLVEILDSTSSSNNARRHRDDYLQSLMKATAEVEGRAATEAAWVSWHLLSHSTSRSPWIRKRIRAM